MNSSLKTSCQCLQVRQRDTKAHLAVIKSIARLSQRILRVHNLQYCGFARLITHSRQAQALRREFSGVVERFQFRTRGLCFVIQSLQFRQQLPLRETQLDPRLLLA